MKWEDRYRQLLEYKTMFGDCNVPQNYPANLVLGKWVVSKYECTLIVLLNV